MVATLALAVLALIHSSSLRVAACYQSGCSLSEDKEYPGMISPVVFSGELIQFCGRDLVILKDRLHHCEMSLFKRVKVSDDKWGITVG